MNKTSIYAHGFIILLTITAANSFCGDYEIYTEPQPSNKNITVRTAQGYDGAVNKLIEQEIYDLKIDNPKRPFYIPSVELLSPHTILSSFGLFKLLLPYTSENARGFALAVCGTLGGIFAVNTLWNKFIASQERYEDYLDCQGQIKALENFKTKKLTQIKIEE